METDQEIIARESDRRVEPPAEPAQDTRTNDEWFFALSDDAQVKLVYKFAEDHLWDIFVDYHGMCQPGKSGGSPIFGTIHGFLEAERERMARHGS
jgi:hypothetical protein